MRFLLILLPLLMLLVTELAANTTIPSTTLAKPGCSHSCGHLSIPYPFGTTKSCSLNASFQITCKNDSKPFLFTNSIYNPFYRLKDGLTVLNISLNGELRVSNWVNRPIVFDWAVGSETCDEARKNLSSYACGKNSICYNSTYGSGYRCNCSKGYDGNPYLPNGCQDINECLNPKLNPCTNVCHKIDGSYICSCPKGHHGDGEKHGEGCIPNRLWLKFLIGAAIIAFALHVTCPLLHWGIKWRIKNMKQREKLFQQNGGLMIKEKLSKLDGLVEKAKIFSIEELQKATNYFDESEIIGRGGFGTVYKGVLPQNKVVAIKKSTIVDESQIEQFVNEVVVLSQINHRNVVKLLGCCLETEIPLLIYEFITNGTLYHHLHQVRHASLITWEIRLRIAKEAAGALAYLHSATSIPIIHRDIKSTNILLDDNFTAKVSDFGAARLVPLDKTQLTTMVQGTFGYLDPEYFHTSQLSEKSDAYSFGVLLVELLTGRKALCFDRPEKERHLATYFLSSIRENRLSLILDDRIVNEGNADEMRQVANIAQNCLRLKGDKRPTMREVAMELEGVARVEKHLWTTIEMNYDVTEFSLRDSLRFHSITARSDGVKNQDRIPSKVDDDGSLVSCTNSNRAMIRVSIQSTENASQVYLRSSDALKWDTI
ncbi:wall-associated receptor kinase 3-like [Cornus florida]|uniref:wall-associated receptor kinase 3-like n=1 Tax=Cornus florida TaxID=4283 RepID=UPI0028A1A251|nr:wall-associated receptor kinase 3-like [Cornus florida]